MEPQRPADAVISLMGKKLRAVYGTIRKEMEARGIRGIDVSHGDILYVLMHHGPQPMSALSRRIDRDKSTVTSLVSKLEKRDMVFRRPDPEDGRSFLVELTAKGKALKPAFDEISRVVLERFWSGISQEEKEIFMDIFCRTAG